VILAINLLIFFNNVSVLLNKKSLYLLIYELITSSKFCNNGFELIFKKSIFYSSLRLSLLYFLFFNTYNCFWNSFNLGVLSLDLTPLNISLIDSYLVVS